MAGDDRRRGFQGVVRGGDQVLQSNCSGPHFAVSGVGTTSPFLADMASMLHWRGSCVSYFCVRLVLRHILLETQSLCSRRSFPFFVSVF